MSRPTCREDLYEYRVKRIFAKLRKLCDEEDPDQSFVVWLHANLHEVGEAFIEDVETYMCIPEPEYDE